PSTHCITIILYTSTPRPPTVILFPYTTLFRSKFMKDGVNATPLPTVNTTGYIDHAAFLGTINPDTNKIGMVNITSSVNSRERSRSEERLSRNGETDLVCRLLLEKRQRTSRVRA